MKYLKNKIFTTEKEFDETLQPFVVETLRRHALEGHFLSLIQSGQDPRGGTFSLETRNRARMPTAVTSTCLVLEALAEQKLRHIGWKGGGVTTL